MSRAQPLAHPMDPTDLRPADEAILDVLATSRATKGYLIDETGYSRNTVYNRLEVLVAAEHVVVVHDPTRLFELVDDPRDTQPAPDPTPVATPEPELQPRPELADVEVRDEFQECTRTDARATVVREIYAALVDAGELKTEAIKARFYEDGDRTELGTEASWWGNLVSPELRPLPGVEAPTRGGNTWRYVETDNDG